MKKIVTIPDYERMMARKYYALLKLRCLKLLSTFFLQLNDAQLLDQTEISKNVVTMNSKVLLKELKRRRKLEIMITYPEEANDQERKVSVFSPIGTALLGRDSWRPCVVENSGGTGRIRNPRYYVSARSCRTL